MGSGHHDEGAGARGACAGHAGPAFEEATLAEDVTLTDGDAGCAVDERAARHLQHDLAFQYDVPAVCHIVLREDLVARIEFDRGQGVDHPLDTFRGHIRKEGHAD